MMTATERKMLDCIVEDYCGIADCLNLEMELGWRKPKVMRVARTLVRLGVLKVVSNSGDYSGRIWEVVK